MQSWARWSKDISPEQRGTLGTFTHSQWQLWCTGTLIVCKWSDESFRVRDQIASSCILGAGSCPESPAGHVNEQVKETAQFSPTLAKPASLTGTYPSSIYWGATETWGISVYWHPHDCLNFVWFCVTWNAWELWQPNLLCQHFCSLLLVHRVSCGPPEHWGEAVINQMWWEQPQWPSLGASFCIKCTCGNAAAHCFQINADK